MTAGANSGGMRLVQEGDARVAVGAMRAVAVHAVSRVFIDGLPARQERVEMAVEILGIFRGPMAFDAIAIGDRVKQWRWLDSGVGHPMDQIAAAYVESFEPSGQPSSRMAVDAFYSLGLVSGCQVYHCALYRAQVISALRLGVAGCAERILFLQAGSHDQRANPSQQEHPGNDARHRPVPGRD